MMIFHNVRKISPKNIVQLLLDLRTNNLIFRLFNLLKDCCPLTRYGFQQTEKMILQ